MADRDHLSTSIERVRAICDERFGPAYKRQDRLLSSLLNLSTKIEGGEIIARLDPSAMEAIRSLGRLSIDTAVAACAIVLLAEDRYSVRDAWLSGGFMEDLLLIGAAVGERVPDFSP